MNTKTLIFIILLGISFFSCSKNDSDNNDSINDNTSKLLKKMSFSGSSNYSVYFFYNANGTIDKIQSSATNKIYQYHYINGNLDKIEHKNLDGSETGNIEKYLYTDGKITEKQVYFDFTTLFKRYVYSYSDNLINNIIYFDYVGTQYTSYEDTFKYDLNKNVISKERKFIDNVFQDDYELTFTYDNKKNPFFNLKPNFVFFESTVLPSINNAITETKIYLSNNNIEYTKDLIYEYDNENYVISKKDGSNTISFEYY